MSYLRLFFDCETGGLDPKQHALLTAYFGVYDDQFNLIDELDLQLKPSDLSQISVQAEAMKVTGINLEEHLNDPKTVTYEEGAKQLLALFERNKIKGKRKSLRPHGQNIQFDINFITNQLIKPELWEKYIHHNCIDTLRILTFLQDVGFLPDSLGKLDSMVRHFNLPLGEAHNAKADVKMTVDVYMAMSKMLHNMKNNNIGMTNNSLLEIIED